jgi:arylsulfatase A-like enzyme/Flp pilus assembly protein TadD
MGKKPPRAARTPPRPQPDRGFRRVRGAYVALVLGVIAVFGSATWWRLRTPSFVLAANPDRNILLVTIDTLRADALGTYGGRAPTPHLDRLAAQGARFDFAHAHAVVTLASHASILTGLYPYQHGIRDNTGYRLRTTQRTAATLLKSQGFATGAFIGGFPLDRRFGLAIGFDVYDDQLRAGATADVNDRERPADVVARSALDWIGRQPGRWFTWVHVYDPHAPYQPPGEWASRFPSEPYLSEVSWTDSALGALFDRLRSQSRPTLVIVTADHGESLGDHGELTHSIFAYEAVLRVPLIVAETRPGQNDSQANGVTIRTPVRHVDLLPTILDLAGSSVDSTLPGGSLKDLIAAGQGADRPSYFEAMTAAVTRGWAPLRGVFLGREKYIDLPVPELYDLTSDPAERANLASARSDRTQVMVNALKLFDVSPPERARQENTDTLERLRSLGYIGGGTAEMNKPYTEADDPKLLIELEQTMERATDAYRRGRANEAIEMYRSVIARRPDTEDAYRKLAFVFWRTGRARDAIATLESALRNGVTQSEVRIKLGQYLAEAGDAVKAIALLEHDAGDDPDALIGLGNAYQLAGRPSDALKTFRRLIEVDPGNGLAYENVGTAQLLAKQYPDAETSLRRAVELDPNLAGAYTALGVVLANTGRKREAIDAWKRAIDLDSGELNALFNVTLNLSAEGRNDEARAYGGRFIATAPPAMARDVEVIRRVLAGMPQGKR